VRVLSAPGGPLGDPNPDPYVYAQCKELGRNNRQYHADDGATPHEDDVAPVAFATTLKSQSITLNCPAYEAAGGGSYVRLMVAVIDKDGSGGIFRDDWMLRSTQSNYACPGPSSWVLRAGTNSHADLDFTVSCHPKPQPAVSIGTGAFGTRDLPVSVAAGGVFAVSLNVDVNEALAPQTLSVTELIPDGFTFLDSEPPPTQLETRVVDGASQLVAAHWDFAGTEIHDRTIAMDIAAPGYATPWCGGVDPEEVAMYAPVAAHFVGLVSADDRRFITHGPHCIEVRGGAPTPVPSPEPLPTPIAPDTAHKQYLPLIYK
jgi:hypothetical protein